MSNRDDFFTTGPISMQTAYVDLADAAATPGTGEDNEYWDVTLGTTLEDYTKAEVYFMGSVGELDSTDEASKLSTNGQNNYHALCRLTSNTNLRIASAHSDPVCHVTGRYYIKEWRI